MGWNSNHCIDYILTIRYYSNDNKRKFKIVIYPLYSKKANGIFFGSTKPQFYEFYAVNFSKNPDSVYFYKILPKRSILDKVFYKIPNEQLDLSCPFEESRPDYQTIGSKERTKIEKVSADLLYSHLSHLYMRTKNNKYLKKMILEIVYVNVEGKEFSKQLIFSTEEICEYNDEQKRKNAKMLKCKNKLNTLRLGDER